MFRQGALDQIYLAKVMSSHSHTFDIGETEIITNPNNVVYVGHSHGGEVGVALPFMENMYNLLYSVALVVASVSR